MTEFNVQFVGTGGTTPSVHRGLPSTLIAYDGLRILVDAGEGTQRALMTQRIGGHFDVIALTHQHADHWLGIPGLLKTWALQGRTEDLRIVGPHAALEAVKSAMRILGDRMPFKVQYDQMGAEGGLQALHFPGFVMSSYKTDHGVPSVGFVFTEEDRPGRFDVDKARALGVTDGRKYGALQRGESVYDDVFRPGADVAVLVHPHDVIGPKRRGRKIVVTGDTRPSHETVYHAHGADLLVHDAAFLENDSVRARRTKHSTVREAVETANRAESAALALVHTGSRYKSREIMRETSYATDGREILLPDDGDKFDVKMVG